MISTQELFRLIRGPIAVAEPLGPYTGLRIGGMADFFIKPRDRADLCRAFGYFRDHGFPFFILGRGSRLLVHEQGFRGTVIATHFLDRLVIDGDIAEADAGVPIGELAGRVRQASLTGLGDFGNGAGTVGGALRNCSGRDGRQLDECVEWVDVLRNGRVKRLKNGELRSRGTTDEVIVGAGFKLRRMTGKDRRASGDAPRLVEQEPLVAALGDSAVSGGVFLDPPAVPGLDDASASALLDACGLRGRRLGDASFSEADANRIVNHGNASSGNILELVELAREAVRQRFGIELELGLVLVGYNEHGNNGPRN